MEANHIPIITIDKKDYLVVGDFVDIKNPDFEIYINLNPDSLKSSEKYIYNFSIKNNDVILFDCIEFVFDLVTTKKTVYVFGNKKSLHMFIFCFFRRWNKYTFEKSMDMTEVFYTIKYNSKLQFNRFELNQLERYNPPVTILICGDRNATRDFDLMIEKEITSLPKKSIVYYGLSKRIDKKIVNTCKKLYIEHEKICDNNSYDDIDFLDNGIECVYVFHEDIEYEDELYKKIIKKAQSQKITVFLFDLKSKEKI